MSRVAFSTVACPEWPLERVVEMGARWGYDGVELRTQGFGTTDFACDPAATDPGKTRRLFADAGLEIASLATGLSFDAPIRPRVMGRVFGDQEKAVRRAKRAIDLAAQVECSLVRVFAFQVPAGEKRAPTLERIVQRLRIVTDHADKTGVRVALENGGSFRTASDLMEIINGVGSVLLGASYSGAVAASAGEDPVHGAAALGERLWIARVKDLRGGVPCLPGDGDSACARFVAGAGAAPWAVFEWDRAWLRGLQAPESALPEGAARLFAWTPRVSPSRRGWAEAGRGG
jgi:sugar phosphate isomerase/epimerase